MTEEQLLKIIFDWQMFWMKQDGYMDRAFGIDANMRYNLAKRLLEAPPQQEEK